MSVLKVGQNFTLTLNGNDVDISGASTLEIHYKKPKSGSTGTKTATAVNTYYARANFENTDNDEHGDWKFEIYAVVSGKIYIGATFTQEIKKRYG